MKVNTQAARLLKHLETGSTISRLAAYVELGIFELSARVIDLERAGYIVDKKRIQVTNRFNEKTSIVEYQLAKVGA